MDLVDTGCRQFANEPGRAAPLCRWEAILDDLVEIRSKLGSLADLQIGDAEVGVRVDVDMDLQVAVEMARMADARGIPASFFVLHTASYYGATLSGVFLRHESMAGRYRSLQTEHTEVGLHLDGLHLERTHGIDANQAVAGELEWLRSIGLEIRAVSGHNCAQVYGAENFEIFSEFAIRPDREIRVSEDRAIALGVLDAAELGIDFEAGAATARLAPGWEEAVDTAQPVDLSDPSWFAGYSISNPYLRWGYELNAWLVADDRWTITDVTRDVPRLHTEMDWRATLDLVRAAGGARTCLTVHPIYFGRRG